MSSDVDEIVGSMLTLSDQDWKYSQDVETGVGDPMGTDADGAPLLNVNW